MAAQTHHNAAESREQESQGQSPEGVFSLLDTDLYKLTMQCAILKYFPDVGMTVEGVVDASVQETYT